MSTCIACKGQRNKVLYQGMKVCLDCGFVWADLDLSAEEWRSLYGREYFFGEEYLDYVKEEPALRVNFQRNLKFIRQFRTGGRLIEIGCAYGFFIDEARKFFDVTGVDIHEEGCAFARKHFGLDARCADFLEIDIPPKSCDVIVMWDVLEHLPCPDRFLEKVHSLLKDDGLLFFSTLDMSSFLARVQGRSWRQIHPPTHVSYFSSHSLTVMLHRLGFKFVDKKYFGEFRTWDNTFFSLFVLTGFCSRFYEVLKKWGWLKGMYYLNTFDHIYGVVAKQSLLDGERP